MQCPKCGSELTNPNHLCETCGRAQTRISSIKKTHAEGKVKKSPTYKLLSFLGEAKPEEKTSVQTKPEKPVPQEQFASDREKVSYVICPPFQPLRLQKKKIFGIGRDKSNDLVFPSGDVSRFHAKIHWTENEYTIFDQQSSNGTYVNDDYIEQHVLHDGDRIYIGTNTILFREVFLGLTPQTTNDDSSLKETFRISAVKRDFAEAVDEIEGAESEQSFSGDLRIIGLHHILQMLATDKKTGCLTVQSEGKKAQIFFLEGMVVDCLYESLRGHDAFYLIVSEQEGHFSFDANAAASEVTMSDYVEMLLLEAARLRDEGSREDNSDPLPSS